MALHVSVVKDDITLVSADVVLLKHARGFYGADEAVALRLSQHQVCDADAISPADGDFSLVDHKCLFYKTIGKLSESLEKTILDMFGRGSEGEHAHA